MTMNILKCDIPYGEKEVELNIPKGNLAEILSPRKISLPTNQEDEIRKAINNPIGTPPLEEIVKGGKKVVIICEDITRSAPISKVLAIVIEKLKAAKVNNEHISIIMALGSHRPMTENEIKRKVGEEIYSRFKVVNSEFKDKSKLSDLGEAPGGVRVWANKRVIRGDVKIGVGSIVPHPAIGFSGGGKIIYPGVVGEETVASFHLRSASVNQNLLGKEENKVRQEMESWIKKVGLDFIINFVLTPNDELYRVVAGHYIQAHRAGVKFSRHIYGVKATRKVDTVVVSSHPADFDFWQGTKGILSGELILKDGGKLILLAPCFEGVGPHPSFPHYAGIEDIESLLTSAKREEFKPAEVLPLSVGIQVARVRKRVRIGIISNGLDRRDAEKAKFKYYTDVDEVQEEICRCEEKGNEISIIPYGSHTYPYF